MTILLAGATGTIGRAVAAQLAAQGISALCPLRPGSNLAQPGHRRLECDLGIPGELTRALDGEHIDAVISCMSTRSGSPQDAWAVDYHAQLELLDSARQAEAKQFVLLSAICVQKPRLAFQHAKLAFEERLMSSDLDWSIVRPTAFFKSLSGQVARVQAGKPFLVFGDGRGTACKPISDRDLADFLVLCLSDETKRNKILPIGGPGPALTPMDQAETLFSMMGQPPRIRHVPLGLMKGIAGAFGSLSSLGQKMREKAEFARTGLYYASESMLVWDHDQKRYDADATPEYGSDTLWDHYADLLSGVTKTDLGAHAVF